MIKVLDMLLVGLTGGIASGKSLVSNILNSLGAYIIDADVIARDLMEPDKPAWRETVEKFGNEILLEDGNINRKMLGNIVFKDTGKREVLNSILHPRIFEEAEKERREIERDHPDAIIIFDAALLIETGAHDFVDVIILVYSHEDLQIQRLTERDGITRQEAIDRIRSQMPSEEKMRFADYVIDTSEAKEDVENKVRDVFQKLKNRADSPS